MDTGDKNADNLAIRQQWESAYKTAPADPANPGYVLEVGGWCTTSTGTCTRVLGTVMQVNISRGEGASMAYHTHGNAGKQAVGQPDGVNYEAHPSDQDVINQGERKPPSYIIGPNTIYRLERGGWDDNGNRQVKFTCLNRWTTVNACPPQ